MFSLFFAPFVSFGNFYKISFTIKYVTEDGIVVGVKTTDRNGNESYCMTGACASDSTAKDYFEGLYNSWSNRWADEFNAYFN